MKEHNNECGNTYDIAFLIKKDFGLEVFYLFCQNCKNAILLEEPDLKGLSEMLKGRVGDNLPEGAWVYEQVLDPKTKMGKATIVPYNKSKVHTYIKELAQATANKN